jgi:hypothetical protein
VIKDLLNLALGNVIRRICPPIPAGKAAEHQIRAINVCARWQERLVAQVQ